MTPVRKTRFAFAWFCCIGVILLLFVGCGPDDKESETPTAVPATAVPPTAITSTAVPPTAVPASAVPPTAVPTTAETPTVVNPTTEASPDEVTLACLPPFNVGPSIPDNPSNPRSYFHDQLIITAYNGTVVRNGRTISLTDIIAQVSGLDPQPVAQFTLYTNPGPGIGIGLYRLAQGQNPVGAADLFNTTALFESFFAVAEPNYVIGQPRLLSTLGAPGSSGVEGSPGGSPVAAPNTQNLYNQWAVTDVGNRIDDGYFATQPVYSTSPTHLFVFDSSHWPTGGYFNNQLCVYDLLGGPGGRVMDHHGLFVASLASIMGKEYQVHLVQVLQAIPVPLGEPFPTAVSRRETLRGDLFTLLGALQALYDRSPVSSTAHSVINLSLGFDFNPDENQALLNSVRNFASPPTTPNSPFSETMNNLPDELGQPNLDLPIVSLGILLQALEQGGYVVVAAAGNTAKDLPQAPASYLTVIGVGASPSYTGTIVALGTEWRGSRTCFSNAGDISAPGGGFMDLIGPTPPPLCQVDLNLRCGNLSANQQCDYALMGHWDGDGQLTPYSWGYWAGTSFAAPLVSGLAVTIVEEAKQASIPLSPAQVRAAVYCIAMYRTTVATSTPSPTTDPTPDPKPSSLGSSVGFITTDPTLRRACINLVK
jgi:hypothetical protein